MNFNINASIVRKFCRAIWGCENLMDPLKYTFLNFGEIVKQWVF